jgi:hypothetical protein
MKMEAALSSEMQDQTYPIAVTVQKTRVQLQPRNQLPCTVELGYDVLKGTDYFMSLYTGVIITEEYNVIVNSEELIGGTGYLSL